MRVETTFVDGIQVGARHRLINPERVAALAESMKEIGLQTPITVHAPDDDTHLLVAGLHRLEAAKKLGWETIPVFFVTMNDIDREMWEISENLHRAGLTKEERDEHIRRYAELLEKRRAAGDRQGAQTADPVKCRGHKQDRSVATQIAAEVGISRDTVKRALNPTPPVSRPVVEVMTDDEIAHSQFEALCRLWNKSSPKARELFKDFVN